MRRLAPLVAGLAACLVLAGCGASGSPASAGDPGKSRVDVDTPALRTLKAKAGVEPCRRGSGVAKGQADGLPDIALPCLGGGPATRLASLRGPMVVNLFAQWCGPCRKELPFYQELHRKARGVVGVLGVDYLDTQPASALRLVDQAGVTFPLLADPDGALRARLRVRGLPGVVFIDRSGRVEDVQFHAFSSYAELRAVVQQQLDVRLPA